MLTYAHTYAQYCGSKYTYVQFLFSYLFSLYYLPPCLLFLLNHSLHLPSLCPQARVLVTHGIGYLPQCDLVVSMDRGCIAEMGMYDELMRNCGEFSEFINVYSNAEESTEEEDGPGI